MRWCGRCVPLVLVLVLVVPSLAAASRNTTDCGTRRQLVQPDRPVVITSPGYPADHARRQRCSWRLQPSRPSDVIRLVCTDVDLAGFRLGVRVGDYLRVRTSGRSRLIQYRDLLHCADVPLTIQGKPGEPVYIRFSSDGLFQRRGFSCQASVSQRGGGDRTTCCRECGISFISESAKNVTRWTTESPTVLSSPAPVISELSTARASAPGSDRPTDRPAATPSTPPVHAAHLSTWYHVTDAHPTGRSPSDPLGPSQAGAEQGTAQSRSVPLRQRGRTGRQQRSARLPARAADLRVVGGEEVAPGAYPWAAFLVLTVQGQAGFICGATVISRSYLVTAAHCVYRADAATVLLGYTSLREPGPHSVQVPAAEAVVHPGWSARFVTHDIALLRLQRPIEYSEAVRPICLPTRQQVAETFAGELGTVLGWGGGGATDGDSKGRLRAAQVPLMANCRCQLVWPVVVTPLKMCASGRLGTSSCGVSWARQLRGWKIGDSGGALQVTSGQGHVVLVGVVSWGSAFGCDRGRPSGYTRVTPYLDWIEAQSGVAIQPN
ncbi:transmembrane protease serine 9-like [Amphibalanus amphitrite]|uniref:transmembrane protease serine 9-like n=1 Tax=Amphibalanus amphitrite TaxID=1232801 RepID=UPI001C92899D|nr:transmembrane protease serine 9-like [Amphibalanus amphitrite]